MQAMYDLVGDKIQEIFDAQVVDIGIFDRDAGLVHFPYTIERGVRFPDEPMALIGFRKQVIETGEPLLINEDLVGRGRRARADGAPSRARPPSPPSSRRCSRGGRGARRRSRSRTSTASMPSAQSDVDLLTTLAPA